MRNLVANARAKIMVQPGDMVASAKKLKGRREAERRGRPGKQKAQTAARASSTEMQPAEKPAIGESAAPGEPERALATVAIVEKAEAEGVPAHRGRERGAYDGD